MNNWTGPTAPASYTPATDAVFFVPGSVMAATSSFFLGGIHSISSGGENVFFKNNDSDVAYAPPWQSVGNHTDPDNRVVADRPVAREYGDLIFCWTCTGATYNDVFHVTRFVKTTQKRMFMLEYRLTRMKPFRCLR